MFRILALSIIILATVSPIYLKTNSMEENSEVIENQLQHQLLIKGVLTYPERVSLPPESLVIIELRDTSVVNGLVIAEETMTITLEDKQILIPFQLEVHRSQIMEEGQYQFRGGIMTKDNKWYLSDPILIEPRLGEIDLGNLNLTQIILTAFSSDLRCGTQKISIGYIGHIMYLTIGAEMLEMRLVDTSSGFKYEAVDDLTTTFWYQGDRAILVFRGETYPECELW